MTKMICQICTNSENNKEFQIREMMFGFRDRFTYFECSNCGCLQIAVIPTNMDKYYPSNYYSFQPISSRPISSSNFPKRFLNQFVGKLLSKRYPDPVLELISKTGIDYESKILDVGCGSGRLLFSLKNAGIKNLLGIDAYIDNEVVEDNIKILKKTIRDLPSDQKFDLIIFHHSFEHLPDQLETLLKVYNMMARNGVCLIAMPLKTEYVWNLYGVDWVQIDAPRHFFVHTIKSFNYLVNKAGLSVKHVVFDSTEFQFWGSEQYKKDIPLEGENSYSRNPINSIFTKKQISEFRERSKYLNKTSQGDQGSFYLVKS